MPTKATAADVFDLDNWIERPPLIAMPELIVPGMGGTVTIVIRANTVDDVEWIDQYLEKNPGTDENQVWLHRMCVAILKGAVTQEQVDDEKFLPTADLTEGLLDLDRVRKLRKQLYEAQWLVVTTALATASLKAPTAAVTAPSSPRSSRARGTSAS